MDYNDPLEFMCLDHPSRPNITEYIRNLTSSYADKSNESSVVATSVAMFVTAAVFFIINIFSRVSDTSSVLKPPLRLVLSTSLSLFPTVMSYLFSEAKNASVGNVRGASSDLSLRARLILTWMLLVELLRKKVEELLVNAGMQGWFSGIFSHGATVAWLGYLVFFNLKGAGRVAVFGSLWILCAAKLVQRVIFTEITKHSFSYGKNARLVSSYMAQILPPGHEQSVQAVEGPDLLKMCNYLVMGEESLVLKAGPRGYQLDIGDGKMDAVVTVGKIWRFAEAEDDKHKLFKSNPRLKRLCLSFALFKLLRRKFEHLPAFTAEETSNCRDLIFKGLCYKKDENNKKAPSSESRDENKKKTVGNCLGFIFSKCLCKKPPSEGLEEEKDGVALFQMLNDEVSFVSEYYHSVLPVVLASPYFFVVRYFLVPTVVLGLCLMTVIVCGKGNLPFAFRSIIDDNYALSIGIFKLTKCLWTNVLKYPSVFFATIDISISYLLFVAVIYEEVWEIIVFVLSHWFMVSLLCTYVSKLTCSQSPTIRGVARRMSFLSTWLGEPNRISFKQFSVLRVCWFSFTLPTTTLPTQAKSSIQKRFYQAAYDHEDAGAPLSNGKYALNSLHRQYAHLSWSCESDSIAEVIFTWHIATSLLEMEYPKHKGGRKVVATRLSSYCSYLVGFHPELLPDDQEGTKRVYKDMKKDLKNELGYWSYFFSSKRTRCEKMTQIKLCPDEYGALTVVQRGAALGKALLDAGNGNVEPVWELLADLWVEIVVYVSPSSREEQVKGHEKALVQKGGLITLLWVLATHTGVTRPPPTYVPVHNVEEGTPSGSGSISPCISDIA